ncbi:MAG: serine/threonine-protein kinase [Planctomycetota bacterium]
MTESQHDPYASLESRLDELLADCLRLPAGERGDALDEASRAHPDLAKDLRERLALLEELGLADVAAANRADDAETPRFGSFVLHEVIGEGGMGVVHRATQRGLEREVVIKLVRPELLHFGRSRERFAREAEAVARLAHPSIAAVHATGEENGVPFIAMELVEGVALDDARGRAWESGSPPRTDEALGDSFTGGPWWRAVLLIGAQLADALHHAHQRGVLHRDVKPSNVLVDPDGRAKLIDFGLHLAETGDDARSRLTREGGAPGTLLYMAPEQVEDGTYDARSEVYALGATLYELLTGAPPHEGDSRSQLERSIRERRPRPPRARNRSLPVDVDAVLEKALHPDPERRYVDMRAFGEDLDRLRAGRPVAARPDGALYRVRRWAGRQPLLAAVSAVALAGVIAVPVSIIAVQSAYADELEASYEEEREARRAEADVARFVIDVLETADPNLARPSPASRAFFEESAARLDEVLGARPRRLSQLRRVLGRIHASMGLREASIELLGASLAGAEALLADEPSDRALDEVIESRVALAEALHDAGRSADAYPHLVRLEDEIGRLRAPESWQVLHARANRMQRAFELDDGARGDDPRPPVADLVDALRAAAAALKAEDGSTYEDIAQMNGWLGQQLVRVAQSVPPSQAGALFDEARESFARSVAAFERCERYEAIDRATAHLSYGVTLKQNGALDEASEQYDLAIELFLERLAPDSDYVVASRINLAGILQQRGKLEEAASELREAYEALDAARGPTDPWTVTARGNLAGVRFQMGDHDGLAEEFGGVIEVQRAALGADRPEVAYSFQKRGVLRAAAGDRAGALDDFRESRRLFVARFGDGIDAVKDLDARIAELEAEGD